MKEIRHLQIEEAIQKIIAELISTGALKDPRIGSFITVSRVVAASDISNAKVYISSFDILNENQNIKKAVEKTIEGLSHASGYIQFLLAKKLKTRLTPKLRFIADYSIQEGIEINQKIANLLK